MMTTTTALENTLNSMMRGELAAVDAYNQALAKADDEATLGTLRGILAHHVETVRYLHDALVHAGGVPAHDAGIWGKFTGAIQGAARLLGNKPALMALREGEGIGLRQYQQAADDTELPGELRKHLRENLVPQTSLHVESLNQLMEDDAPPDQDGNPS